MLGLMAERQSVCLRRLAGGLRRRIIGFGRFLANGRVTAESLIAGWGHAASESCAGRHVLAVQDTSANTNDQTEGAHRSGV